SVRRQRGSGCPGPPHPPHQRRPRAWHRHAGNPGEVIVTHAIRFIGPMVIGGTLALTACSRNEDPPLVGTLERDRIEIIAEEAEPILSLEVREGDHVTMGQVLVRQETEVAAARIAQANAQALEARHRLTELERGARKETIAEARARVAMAKAAADRDE